MLPNSPLRVACVLCMFIVLIDGQCGHAARPNIVYIMADDLGYGDVKCFGGNRCRIETPHIDALAAQGMRFTDAHSPAAVCVPTRVGVMTGRHPWRFQRPRPSGPWGFLNPQIPTDHFTIGRMLQNANYRTGYAGKWHLGTLMETTTDSVQGPNNVDFTQPLRIGPNDYGFDWSFILPGSLDMYPYAFVRDGRFVGSVTAQKGWSAFNRVGPAEENFEDVKVLDSIMTEAELFLAKSGSVARDRKPFFLYVALTAPHTPTCPSPAFEGRSRLGLYGDFVMETDHCVGRVMRSLDELGLADDTLVIFTSDHGAASYAGNIRKATPGQLRELEKQGHYSSGEYRGYKFSIYEGGTRVPFVARWPGVIPAQSQCDRLIGLIDVMSTLAEAAGVDLSDKLAPDSISFRTLLSDPDEAPTRPTLIVQSIDNFAIRDGQWKLALCPGSGAPGVWGNTPIPSDAWRTAIDAFGRHPATSDLDSAPFVQLFDLSADPGETRDLAADDPERVAAMIDMLADAIHRGRTTPGPELANDVPRVNTHPRIPDFARPKKKAPSN